MNKLVRTAALLLLVTGTAIAGPAPAWCKEHAARDSLTFPNLSSTDPRTVVEALAIATCAPTPEVEANRAAIEQSRQAWGKRLAMKDADWADVIASLAEEREVAISTKDPAQYTALDQYAVIVDGLPRPNGEGRLREPLYAADMFGARLTEVGRLGYVARCLSRDATPAEWAICQADLDKLDVDKALAQITADTSHDGEDRMNVRYVALDVAAKRKQHPASVQAAWKRDPAYKRMFEVATAARAEWDATLAGQATLLATVARAESAHVSRSRSAQAGCDKDTATALAAAVGKLSAKKFEKIIDKRFDPDKGVAAAIGPLLMESPEVTLAATAYVLCNRDGTASLLRTHLQETPTARGPRTLSFTRMLTEKLQLDDADEQIKWPGTARLYSEAAGAPTSRGGVIASTRVDGDVVVVTFEKMLIKRKECVESHATNRIYKIHPDGRVEYEQVCDAWGIVTHDDQWMDFRVDKKFQPLLKKGVRISVVGPSTRGAGDEVIATWANKTTEVPAWLLGGALK